MLTHRGFSAWIVSNGAPIDEYLVTVDEKNHCVSCWVPGDEGRVSVHSATTSAGSHESQTFSVHWRDHGSRIDSCGFISLDGFVVPGRFLLGDGETSRQGVRTGNATERPFVFGRVEAPGD